MKKFSLFLLLLLSTQLFADFSSDATSAPKGSTITLTWSSSASSCTASDSWSGSKSGSGTEEVTLPAEGWNIFTLNCGSSWEYVWVWGTAEVAQTNSAPVITGLSSSISVEENQTSAVTVSASDTDGDTLSYSLSGTDSSSLSISSTGVITFNSSPDYETKNIYDITIEVNDGTVTTTQALSINITDVDDSDDSSGSTGNVTYFVTVSYGSNSFGTGDKFLIDGIVSPSLTFEAGKTYSFDQSDSSNFNHPLRLSSTSNGTHGGGNFYTLNVTTYGTPGYSGAYTRIVVTSSTATTLNYFCANHSGFGGSVSTSSSGSPGTTTPAESLVYSLSGTDSSHFTIDEDSGEVNFESTPSYIYPSDANNDNVYDIKVKVSSGLDNAPPSFGSITGSSVINEGRTSSIYVKENKNSVGSVSVTDSENDNLTYSLSGDDSSYFSISDTGEITLNETLDYETPLDIDGDNVYALTVTVSDGINSVTKDLSINVEDVVEVSDAGDLAIIVDENVESFELGLPANATNVRVYTSNGYADDLDGKETVTLGNEDGSPFILNEDKTYSSNEVVKMISDIQIGTGVTLKLEGASIYSTSTYRLEVRNGHFEAENAKIRKIHVGNFRTIANGKSTPGSILIKNSSFIKGHYQQGGYEQYGSHELLNNYFEEVISTRYIHFWYPQVKLSIKGNIFYDSGALDIGFRGSELQSEPQIMNNVFVHGDSTSKPRSANCNAEVYICLWAASGDYSLKLEGNAYLNETINSFVAGLSSTTDKIISDSEYFGVTNTTDISDRYLDSSDNLDFNTVIVNNPVSQVDNELNPVFHPKISYDGSSLFKFEVAPDYEAGSRTLNYTIEYTDAGTPKTSTLTITVNDLVD